MFKLNPLAVAMSVAIAYPMASFAADTGDAPASYGLAAHEIVASAPYIGVYGPDDNAPINSANADGDDNDAATDDEDGVFGFPVLVQNAKAYDVNVFVTNPSAQNATLVGWVDFDGNNTFDPDEAVSAEVPAGADNMKFKLIWPDTFGISSDYYGQTYARFRITTGVLTASDALGNAVDGEVEDYTFLIEQDSDGDETPDSVDTDNDNDGIPDAVEGTTVDTDNDGQFNYLDADSDGDSLMDFAEAGPNPNAPQDTDGDGQPDYLDTDSNNDGILDSAGDANDSDSDGISDAIEGNIDTDGDGIINSQDIDSDNDAIPDSIEVGVSGSNPVDTDGDLIFDYLDIDSDNDGIPDLYESNNDSINPGSIDLDVNGVVDNNVVFGANGYVDDIETQADSGIPVYAVPDSDGDGVRDFRDTDSDNDGTNDVVEAGGTDNDNNGLVDAIVDVNMNNIPDGYDYTQTGGVDTDGDGIDDSVDSDFVAGPDQDNDGVLDTVDFDINGDGLVDSVLADQANDLFLDGSLPDVDGDFIPDFRDADAVGAAGGSATAGTTTGDTGGGVTTGGTNGGDTGGTANPDSNGDAIVETGLSGSACSISTRAGNDPMFPGLLLLSSIFMFARRRSVGAIFKR